LREELQKVEGDQKGGMVESRRVFKDFDEVLAAKRGWGRKSAKKNLLRGGTRVRGCCGTPCGDPPIKDIAIVEKVKRGNVYWHCKLALSVQEDLPKSPSV